MIRDIFVMSLDAMRSYKVRTFLTLIGVIIGVGSVIMVTTAGNSVSSFVRTQWNVFDPVGMVIGTGTSGVTPQLSIRSVSFTAADVEKIQGLPNIKTVAPLGIVTLKKVSLRNGFLKWESRPGNLMYASTAAILKIFNSELESGTMFEDGKNEIVISKSFSEVFGKDKTLKVGDTIYVQRIDTKTLEAKIVGILKQNTASYMVGSIATPDIICPTTPYYSTYFGSNVGTIFKRVTAYSVLLAEADDITHVQAVQDEVLNYLENGSSDAGQYKDKNTDFVIITQQYIVNRIDQVMSVIRLYITAIALISLIIGGIGIANIMFATVTERTREIGTMMAIGAKRRDILQLFLYQSTIIGLLGGILGIILGIVGSAFVVNLLNSSIQTLGGAISAGGNIGLSYSVEWFVIAAVVGLVIGVFAGVLPARKAAKMDPVVALRYE
ncbi:MAG TPA: ABC transporter permease [Candidatus Thermoplasmatota archaeon]|nr:ABC transporter permease [Candidatus Thermoplasmatota archaeon]